MIFTRRKKMQDTLSLQNIIIAWQTNIIALGEGDPLYCIKPVSKSEFNALRAKINASFDVGDYPDYTGEVEEDTEFGDITDTMLYLLEQRFPQQQYAARSATTMLSIETRKAWRDEMLKALDAMAPR
jgi:hypothetical protein